MPICKKIRTDHRKVCIGDMRWLIDIFDPRITPPATNSVDYTVTKSTILTVWAALKTVPNVAIFDSMNIEQTVSHDFYVRFFEGLTVQYRIRYPSGTGQYYQIIMAEDFENRHEFLRLRCNIKGAEANA